MELTTAESQGLKPLNYRRLVYISGINEDTTGYHYSKSI